ncbi:uncharacterized protein LOC143883661 [Tasmannia lanceolata]|uniref:uncharacterized protein LOC143883661 n=1 Tax=Tasmannia lanceolata TaxID=3420 RepID=UPI0040628705
MVGVLLTLASDKIGKNERMAAARQEDAHLIIGIQHEIETLRQWLAACEGPQTRQGRRQRRGDPEPEEVYRLEMPVAEGRDSTDDRDDETDEDYVPEAPKAIETTLPDRRRGKRLVRQSTARATRVRVGVGLGGMYAPPRSAPDVGPSDRAAAATGGEPDSIRGLLVTWMTMISSSLHHLLDDVHMGFRELGDSSVSQPGAAATPPVFLHQDHPEQDPRDPPPPE